MNLYKEIKKGDTIGVVGVANSIYRENRSSDFERAKKLFLENGFKLRFANNCLEEYYGMAGTPKEKAKELMKMYEDDDVKMIICLDGGDSCNTLIDYLDYKVIKKHPKPIMGYSDITVLLEAIYKKTGIITFHGPAFLCFGRSYGQKCMDEFKSVFMKKDFSKFLDSKLKCIRKGNCKGKIIGTNLESSLYIMNTKYFPNLKNNIFVIERYITSVSETYNHFYQLKQMGVFDKITGLLIGYNYSFQSEKYGCVTDIQMEDIAKEVSEGYDFPIFKCETFGHEIANVIIPIGAKYKIKDNKINLLEKIFY